MFNLLVDASETCGKFWKDCVASRPVEIYCLDVTPLYRFIWNNRAISTHSSTQKAIVINRKWAVVLIVLTHAGETPYDYISAIYRMTGNIKALCLKQWTVQLMSSIVDGEI